MLTKLQSAKAGTKSHDAAGISKVVYRHENLAPVAIVCAESKGESSSKKTATANLREFVDLHQNGYDPAQAPATECHFPQVVHRIVRPVSMPS